MYWKLLVAISFALTGCVTSSSAMLGDNVAIISTKGMGWGESNADLIQKASSEAAKMALARGFTHFSFDSSEDATTVDTYYMPGNVTSNTTGQATCYGYTCSGSATTNTTGYGPRAIPVVRRGADIYVTFYRSENEAPPHAFSAARILEHK